MITKLSIPCVWGGQLAGILLKNNGTSVTTKIIAVHGWLDNLNSLLPLAEKLMERQKNYEIFLYDRAGHGFSSHLPVGGDYSLGNNLRDLRIIIQTLGWTSQKLVIIGHSFGSIVSMMYAASYPKEVSCVVTIDTLTGSTISPEHYWERVGANIDTDLNNHRNPPNVYQSELTFEKAVEVTKRGRLGISDEAAKLLTERSIRRDEKGILHFSYDRFLKTPALIPGSQDMAYNACKSVQAPVLLIKAQNPRWPISESVLRTIKEHNPNFEMASIDGPHHLHMTHVDTVADLIEQYFAKHLPPPPSSSSPIDDSKL